MSNEFQALQPLVEICLHQLLVHSTDLRRQNNDNNIPAQIMDKSQILAEYNASESGKIRVRSVAFENPWCVGARVQWEN